MRYVKLFEDWLTEADPLGDLGLGGDEGGDKKVEKPKEDPLEKQRKEAEKKEKKAREKYEDKMDNSLDKIEDLLKNHPDMKEQILPTIQKALEKSDRALIRNAINDVIFLQQKYQTDGDDKSISLLTKVKDILSAVDKTYTTNKYV
jgi:hypothetical protein